MDTPLVFKIDRSSRVKGVNNNNVQAVGNELFNILNKHGNIKPETVLVEAKKTWSPLHNAFEWDDSVAAHEHRLWQARTLVNSVRVVTERGEEILEQRVFVNVITGTSRGYMYIPQVMSNEALREQVLKKAENDLLAWKARYEELTELAEIFTVIERIVERKHNQVELSV